jgi:hypothetical protein
MSPMHCRWVVSSSPRTVISWASTAGAPHPGIAYCPKDSRTIGEIIDALVLIWELYDPEEMVDQVEFI